MESVRNVLALSGGVGGAKLALGLASVLSAEQLTVVANTADDFEHLGLSISPDLDTVMYTLAGLSNQQLGWGLANESWNTMDALTALGGETWFRLGDRDIATHLERSERLRQGQSLTAVTDYLARTLGVQHPIIPMTDDPVRTKVKTAAGELAFQHYFVREQCQPEVTGFYFDGIDNARPSAALMDHLASEQLDAIVICPSNPFVSVEPMLQLAGVREAMQASQAPVIAVSPIVGGIAIKGPAAKMMAELKMPTTALSVAQYYGELLDGFVMDASDETLAPAVRDGGVPVLTAPTIMKTLADRIDLANTVLSFAAELRGRA